jgi:hypothetical protein
MANLDSAIQQLMEERDRLDKAIAILTSLDGSTLPKAKSASVRPKRKISPAGLARIRAAATARWAKVKAAKKK